MEFTQNMQFVLDSLTGRDPFIRLVSGVDEICLECPHNVQGVCTEDPHVSEMDREVLKLCHLKPDESLRYSEFSGLIFNGILLAGKQNLVCAGCQWQDLCQSFLSVRDSTPNTPSDISE